MQIKTILKAAVAAISLSVAGASAASADPWDHGGGFGYHDHFRDRDERRFDRHFDRRFADRDRIFWMLRDRHIRFAGDPFFLHSRYVVRSYDRFGRVVFVEVNPYTGGFIGFVRL